MRKYISSALAAMLFSSSAFAANQTFYRVDVQPGAFYVFGVTADSEKENDNPACYAEINWRDGSRFQLIRDLADGELYIFFRNANWSISDPAGLYDMRINFYNRTGGVSGLNFQYRLINKNTIIIRNIKKELFLPLFTGNNKASLLMPGSIQNAEVDLTGSSKALAEISKCIEAARGVDLYPEGRPAPNGETRPRSFDNI